MSNGPFRVTLLGTGGPPPRVDRFGPSTLVEAGEEKFIFDAGRGALQRLYQLRIPFGDITGLFLTHLHSDHVVGIPDLWLTGWNGQEWGRRETPLRVWGPAETRDMMANLERAFQFDIRVRSHYPKQGVAVVARDFTAGVVYDDNGVKVTAFEVDHGRVKPAYGYRINFQGHSVVLSGDTRFNDNVVQFSRGADLLVHEVALMTDEFMRTGKSASIIAGNHTTAEEAGRVFDLAKPRLAVYSHILEFGGPEPEELIGATRRAYSGRFEVGEDLMSIEIGKDISIRPWADMENLSTDR
jgi:ribonuclease Z